MKKTIFYTFLSLFLLFIIVNYKIFFSLFYNFLGNYFYDSGNYNKSLVFHSRAHNYSPSDRLLYNIGNDFYKLENYNLAIKNFNKSVLSGDKDMFLSSVYNLANSLYRLGEKHKEVSFKVNLWRSSLNLYLSLLSSSEGKKAKDNYDFVRKKLEELQKKEDEDKPGTKEENPLPNPPPKVEGIEQQEKEKEVEQSEEGNNKKSPSNEKANNQSGALFKRQDIHKLYLEEDIEKITSLEKQKVREYIDFLIEEQEKNKIFFNDKKNLEESPDSFLQIFKNDPFFKDIF